MVIPAYNESQAIAGLISGIRRQGLEVVVVDDGSGDDTLRLAKDSQATVLHNQKTQGKGAALIKGFSYALSNNFDAVVTMDGDGQHDPDDLPCFLSRAESSKSAIFIGNRMWELKNMPWLRSLTNRFMSWMISKISRQKIADTQCGFRLIKRELLEKLRLRTAKYETESEMIIQAARLGFKIESLPIKTIYQGEKSQIHPLMDTCRFIRLILRELLWT